MIDIVLIELELSLQRPKKKNSISLDPPPSSSLIASGCTHYVVSAT